MKKPLVIVQAWLLDRRPSGARNRLLGLLAGLRETGADLPRIECWVTDRNPPDPELLRLCRELPQASVRPVPIPPRPTAQRVAAERRHLRRLLSQAGAELLDLASLPLPPLDIPCVLTLHDLRDRGSFARSWRRLFLSKALRDAGRRALLVLTPSPHIARECADLPCFAETPLRVVPCPVPPPFAKTSPPAAPGESYLCHLGRPEARKNLPFLLEAFAEARRREPGLPPLLLCGPEDPGWRRLRRLAENLGLGNHLRLRLDPKDLELPRLLGSAWALALPSLYEGFGLPALEAASLGVPVLAMRGSPPSWIAGPGALALPPSVEDWTDGLLDLWRDPDLRHELGRRAREASARFHPRACATAWLHAWKEALGEASSLPPAADWNPAFPKPKSRRA